MDIIYPKHEIGKLGEEIVTKYLQKEGYEILNRNFFSRKGEIDIIAKDKDELVFIEVKTRSNKKFGKPSESVTEFKQKHIIKAAKYYLYITKQENELVRIDVIEVSISKKKYYIHHIKQII